MQETIVLTNKISEMKRLKGFIAKFGEENHFSRETIFDIILALEEIFTNIVHYGFTDTNPHEIVIQIKREAGFCLIRVEDDGKSFNPLKTPEPDLTKSLEEREGGGLGIYLNRKLMDHLDYERNSGKNILLMKKAVT